MAPAGSVSPRTASTGSTISRKTPFFSDRSCSTWCEAARKPLSAARPARAPSTGGTERLPSCRSPLAASHRISDAGSARSETRPVIADGSGISARALAASQRSRSYWLPGNPTRCDTASSPIAVSVSRARRRVTPSWSPSCVTSSSNRRDCMSAPKCLDALFYLIISGRRKIYVRYVRAGFGSLHPTSR